MSLDFYLETEPQPFICHECGHESVRPKELFHAIITHNLKKMADKAGIYEVLWHPNDKGQVRAKDIIETLSLGLSKLLKRRKYFEKFNSPNGWGTHGSLVCFVENVLGACRYHPDAFVRVSI